MKNLIKIAAMVLILPILAACSDTDNKQLNRFGEICNTPAAVNLRGVYVSEPSNAKLLINMEYNETIIQDLQAYNIMDDDRKEVGLYVTDQFGCIVYYRELDNREEYARMLGIPAFTYRAPEPNGQK